MRRLALLPFVLAFAACDHGITDEGGGDPEAISFAASLEVNLAAMTKTATGLYYQDLVVGTGAVAVVGSTPAFIYQGWLPDGTEFEARTDPERPLSGLALGEGNFIAGFEEGLLGMREGGRRKLVIRPALAYGQRGQGLIPPNSTVVFEIGLISVTPPPP